MAAGQLICCIYFVPQLIMRENRRVALWKRQLVSGVLVFVTFATAFAFHIWLRRQVVSLKLFENNMLQISHRNLFFTKHSTVARKDVIQQPINHDPKYLGFHMYTLNPKRAWNFDLSGHFPNKSLLEATVGEKSRIVKLLADVDKKVAALQGKSPEKPKK